MNPIIRYTESQNISLSDLAARLDVTVQSVWRYANDKAIPRKKIMRRLTEISNGEIQPNDFYGVS